MNSIKTKKNKNAPPVAATDSRDVDLAKIVRRVPRANPLNRLPKKAAGVYRVIHGRVAIPLAPETYTRPDGTIDENKPRMEMAQPGDEVEISSADATRLFAAKMIEELDANPSQVGKGHKILKPTGPAPVIGTVLEYPAPVAG